MSVFVSYFVAKHISQAIAAQQLCVTMASGTANAKTISAQGLLAVANGLYSAVSSISILSSYIRLTGIQTPSGNLSFLMILSLFQEKAPVRLGT